MCWGRDDALDDSSPVQKKKSTVVFCFVCHERCATTEPQVVRGVVTGMCEACTQELEGFAL